MLIPFGILSAAGISSDYELIETQILGTAAASVTFSGLAAYADTYKHLQIRATIRTNRTGQSGDIFGFRFNGDTGSNYNAHELAGTGSAVVSGRSGSQTSMWVVYVAATSQAANNFTAMITDITDAFSSTKNTTARSFLGIGDSDRQVVLMSGLWRNTASLTSIQMFGVNSASVAVGSRFSLYGIKG
jgi:hypothetical protein